MILQILYSPVIMLSAMPTCLNIILYIFCVYGNVIKWMSPVQVSSYLIGLVFTYCWLSKHGADTRITAIAHLLSAPLWCKDHPHRLQIFAKQALTAGKSRKLLIFIKNCSEIILTYLPPDTSTRYKPNLNIWKGKGKILLNNIKSFL